METLALSAQGLAMALSGNLLKYDGILKLIETETLEDAIRYLAEFPCYRDPLPSISELGAVEKSLKQSIIHDAARLRRFIPDDVGNVLDKLMARYELDNIKAVINGFRSGRTSSQVKDSLYDMKPFIFINEDELLRASSIEDVLKALEDTRYGPPLQDAYESCYVWGSLFPLENALDLFHFQDLWSSIDALSYIKRRFILQVLGTEMDLRQIQWILRFKINFYLPPNDIYSYILKRGYLLQETTLDAMINASDFQEFLDSTPSPYFKLLEESQIHDDVDLMSLEINSWRYIYRTASDVFKQKATSYGMLFAYLIIKRVEVDDIISILECKYYGMEKEDILLFLIGAKHWR